MGDPTNPTSIVPKPTIVTTEKTPTDSTQSQQNGGKPVPNQAAPVTWLPSVNGGETQKATEGWHPPLSLDKGVCFGTNVPENEALNSFAPSSKPG
ncbi:MAG: hypothetical protein KTR19_11345, partial [Hyphomicrobiales bacterium]|nr:hypothetical protein [Hyphomicrobiales bacterium]